jgi:hypothetical protein
MAPGQEFLAQLIVQPVGVSAKGKGIIGHSGYGAIVIPPAVMGKRNGYIQGIADEIKRAARSRHRNQRHIVRHIGIGIVDFHKELFRGVFCKMDIEFRT